MEVLLLLLITWSFPLSLSMVEGVLRSMDWAMSEANPAAASFWGFFPF
jgi:hypothetical protein